MSEVNPEKMPLVVIWYNTFYCKVLTKRGGTVQQHWDHDTYTCNKPRNGHAIVIKFENNI